MAGRGRPVEARFMAGYPLQTARSPPSPARPKTSQGNRTAIPQIVAEELDVPVASVRVLMGDTARRSTRARPWAASRSLSPGPSSGRPQPTDGKRCLPWPPPAAASRRAISPSRTASSAPLGDPSRRVSYGGARRWSSAWRVDAGSGAGPRVRARAGRERSRRLRASTRSSASPSHGSRSRTR